MHKHTLCLTWRKDGEVVIETNVIPVDIQIKNKAEYLVAKTSEQCGLFSIRLDYIIEMRSSTD